MNITQFSTVNSKSNGGGSGSGTHAGSLPGEARRMRVDSSVMPSEVVDTRTQLCDELLRSPIPPQELIRNLGLYLLPMELKRFLFFAEMYQQFITVPGVLMEFGCRWGQNLATLQSLRSILEPFHHRRKIVGFDTFSGFPEVAPEDGQADAVAAGAYAVTQNYAQHLQHVMRLRETQAPLAEVQKFAIVEGDVSQTLPAYLEQHPETIVAFAYFDVDLYQPTLDCLRLLQGRLTQGSIIGFDELNHAAFPGETRAVQDALGLQNLRLRRSPFSADECYFVVES